MQKHHLETAVLLGVDMPCSYFVIQLEQCLHVGPSSSQHSATVVVLKQASAWITLQGSVCNAIPAVTV